MASSSKAAVSRSSADASFSNAPAPSESHRPPSAISSRMTEIVSEDGDEYYPEGIAAAARPKTRGALGFANDSTRPPSAMSTQRSAWTQASPSRRALRDWKTSGTFGGAGAAFSNTSRPQSAASRTSRTSRTHVPSITSHAFFRPMSSQRLQAQRGTRPSTKDQDQDQSRSVASRDESMYEYPYHEAGTPPNRQSASAGSVHTLRPSPLIHQGHGQENANDAVPPSRGTEFTEDDHEHGHGPKHGPGAGHEHDRDYAPDRTTATASPNGEGTVQSLDDSVRPLHNKASSSNTTKPTHLNMDIMYQQGHAPPSPLQKSPHSFRSNFLRSGKGESPARNGTHTQTQNHARLDSYSASQRSTQSKMAQQGGSDAGLRNYQYFSGNTVFCWGGRLQNTRDRPMNLATGFLVILPSVLFLVFS
ncbi:Eukaryotic peptide chain release factor GTP-binding subunit [Hypocenomyce scalaris]|nr:Eukaryotic peptide chain release factor GTP-binding subunit [Hypocenomyce scalaris]